MAEQLVQQASEVRTDATAAQGGTPVWATRDPTTGLYFFKPNVHFRIRQALGNAANGDAVSSSSFQLQYSKDPGATGVGGVWYNIGTTGSEVIAVDATGGVSSNGQVLTTALLGLSPFMALGDYSTTGISNTFSLPAGGALGYVTEIEYALKFVSPSSGGNQYSFRMVRNGSAVLDYYVDMSKFLIDDIGVAAITEADDAVTARAYVPNIEANDVLVGFASETVNGVATITEANDTMVGRALTSVAGLLAQTEANDSIAAWAAVIPVGGAVGVAGIVEADDVLTGACSSPLVAILNVVEDSDTLVSRTIMGANQWILDSGCAGSPWVEDDSCGDGGSPPIIVPVPPVVEGGEMLFMEQLPVLGVNSIGDLSHIPNMDLFQITVDGRPFFPVGAAPDFGVNGTMVTWINPYYSVGPGSTVIASYSWTSS